MKKNWALGLLCLLLAACQNDPNLEVTAVELCRCLVKIPELNRQLADRLPEADQEELTDILAVLSAAAADTRQCLQDKKLPLHQEDPLLESLQPFLNVTCPDWRQVFASLPPPPVDM